MTRRVDKSGNLGRPRAADGLVRARLRQLDAPTSGSHALARSGADGTSDSATGSAAGERVAALAARAGLEKKAEDVQIINVAGKVDYADYLVLMTGTSDRNVAAIARGVEEDLNEEGVRALAVEGLPLARWVLIDLVDVVVHVFQAEWRGVYDLDGLWMDAPRLPLPEVRPPTAVG